LSDILPATSGLIWNSYQKLKYLGINLINGVKELYNENYKTLKEKKDKTFNVHGLEQLELLKCLYCPKQSQIKYNPHQNINDFFTKKEKKITWNPKKCQIRKKKNLEQKE
jgi:hypothetical protein